MCISFLGKENWLGLDAIHKLTSRPNHPMKLKVSLERFSGEKISLFWDVFKVENEVTVKISSCIVYIHLINK